LALKLPVRRLRSAHRAAEEPLTKKRRLASLAELPPSIAAITQARKSSAYPRRLIPSSLSPYGPPFHLFASKILSPLDHIQWNLL